MQTRAMPRFDSNPTWDEEEFGLVMRRYVSAMEDFEVAAERVTAARARARVEKVLPMEARAAVIWKLAAAKEAEVVAAVMQAEFDKLYRVRPPFSLLWKAT